MIYLNLYDNAQLTDPYDPIYDGCSSATNSSKACFGMPQVIIHCHSIAIFVVIVIVMVLILKIHRVAKKHGSAKWSSLMHLTG